MYTAAPILKQASPRQSWYEHLFAPDGSHGVAHFSGNLSDVAQRADEVTFCPGVCLLEWGELVQRQRRAW